MAFSEGIPASVWKYSSEEGLKRSKAAFVGANTANATTKNVRG